MRLVSAIVLCIALAGSALGADVRVRYLVDGKRLRGIPSGTVLIMELAGDPACQSVIATRAVAVQSTLIEILRPAKVANGPKPRKIARIEHVLAGLTPTQALYLRISGAQIEPVGEACQQQLASVGAAETIVSCPADSARVGGVCIDRYEESIWTVSPGSDALVAKIKDGSVTLGDLTTAGAVQRGVFRNFPGSYGCGPFAYPPTFHPDGTSEQQPFYAVSVPGVYPSVCLTAFQADAACAVSGKRLLRTAEFLDAAAHAPDTDPDDHATGCNTDAVDHIPIQTGARSACVSSDGLYDLIGNAAELVEGSFGSAWARGGDAFTGSAAGAFSSYSYTLTSTASEVGFRCGR